MQTIIVHLNNDDPVLAEIEKLPDANATNIVIQNPRRRDGKAIPYLERGVTAVMWPMHRITFIELLSGENQEEIITFVRE